MDQLHKLLELEERVCVNTHGSTASVAFEREIFDISELKKKHLPTGNQEIKIRVDKFQSLDVAISGCLTSCKLNAAKFHDFTSSGKWKRQE